MGQWTFLRTEKVKKGRIRAGIFKPLWRPGIDAKASIPPAYVALAGRYDNPIPTQCLAPLDFLKIPAPLKISENGFYMQILKFHCPSKILCHTSKLWNIVKFTGPYSSA